MLQSSWLFTSVHRMQMQIQLSIIKCALSLQLGPCLLIKSEERTLVPQGGYQDVVASFLASSYVFHFSTVYSQHDSFIPYGSLYCVFWTVVRWHQSLISKYFTSFIFCIRKQWHGSIRVSRSISINKQIPQK